MMIPHALHSTVLACSWPHFGQAERLTGDGDQHARTVAAQRLGSLPSVFDTASAYRVSAGTLDDKKSTGNCWYFYS